jgi:methyl-accepting chemotaxis protein
MSKILIFGAWYQWKKYINYFSSNNYFIDIVNTNWINKINNSFINNTFKYSNIIESDFDFSEYNYIVIAVNPYEEQIKVINFILSNNIKRKIIIEKPVAYDIKLLEKLLNYDNIYYFSDEIALGKIYKKIFQDLSDIIIFSTKNVDILEHILSWFLLFKDLEKYLQKIIFKFENLSENKRDLNYKILYNKYSIENNKWNLKLNWRNIYNLNFSDSLSNILDLDLNNNYLIKKNFILLRNFLNNVH